MVKALAIRENALDGFEYYHYSPSMAAAVIFIVLFAGTTAYHWWQMIRKKSWFMTAFCIGGIFELIGYIGRAASSNQTPNYTLGPYIIQSLFLLVAPALFAASIYMVLARVVLLAGGESALFIRRRWLTRIFVSGDVFSFLVQASGGGLMAAGSDSSANTGKTLVLVGLILQLVYFALFVVAGGIFQWRMSRQQHFTQLDQPRPEWRKYMLCLYIVSALIYVRSIVRVVEYAQGFSGYIISHEVYLYVFDALLMFAAMVCMNVIHPGAISVALRGHSRDGSKPIHLRNTVQV